MRLSPSSNKQTWSHIWRYDMFLNNPFSEAHKQQLQNMASDARRRCPPAALALVDSKLSERIKTAVRISFFCVLGATLFRFRSFLLAKATCNAFHQIILLQEMFHHEKFGLKLESSVFYVSPRAASANPATKKIIFPSPALLYFCQDDIFACIRKEFCLASWTVTCMSLMEDCMDDLWIAFFTLT